MLRILIIDDEVLVRVGLKSLINWNEYNYQIVGEASNGEEGLQLIKELEPDLVITDIKMPVKDGLELIKDSRDKNYDCKFIVLSSFDEFHLVKEAMKLGAVDYLIKLELDEKVLLDILISVEEIVNKEKKKKKNKRIIKYNINENKLIKEEFFKKVIGRLISDRQEIRLLLNELNIQLNEDMLAAMAIQINNNDQLNKFEKGDTQLFKFSIINIVEEIVNDFFEGYAFMNNWGEIVIVFSPETQGGAVTYDQKIEEMVSILNTMLKQYFAVNVSIAISNIHQGFNHISDAYIECYESLKYSFQSLKNQVIFYKDLQRYQQKSDKIIYFNDFTETLSDALEMLDILGLRNCFLALVERIKIEGISRNQAYELCFQITYLIKNRLKSEVISRIFDNETDFYKQIEAINNIAELLKWLDGLKDNLIVEIDDYLNNEKSFIIRQAQKIIKQQFRKELNLTEIADRLNVSSGYLSTLFKELVGIGFAEYITKLRIEEAKNLLSQSNFKIYEISEKVGYNNPYYFSKVFKKCTGKTPSQYR